MSAVAWPAVLGGLLLGYLSGSIPFGFLFTRMAGLGDVRSIGSGNIGATNVLRTGRKGLAAVTLLADALKGTVPILLADHFLGIQAAPAAAIGAFLGHCFPVWLGFKGGKGVATYVGCLLALDWRLLLLFAVVWIGVARIGRMSSLASLTTTLVCAAASWWLEPPATAAVVTALTVLAWAKHHANISRLLAGTESRIGQKG